MDENDLDNELRLRCLELFHCRCVRCTRHAEIVHHIIPRSRGRIAQDLDNMVCLCADCHHWAHETGVNVAGPILRQAREHFINAYSSG